jgi:hypothetical protein
MKKLSLLTLVALLAFGAGAYVSWKWQTQETPPADVSPSAQPPASTAKTHSDDSQTQSRTAVGSTAEETTQLAASLRGKMAAVREKEQQLAARQKQLELIYQDIRSERAKMEDYHKRIHSELEAAEKQSAPPKKPSPQPDSTRQSPKPKTLMVPLGT